MEEEKKISKVPFIDKAAWCAMGWVNSFPWVGCGYYLLYFYTDCMHLSAALAGTVMFAARLFDAFTDLFIGWCVDNVHWKWGKFRTWIFFAIFANIIIWPLTWVCFPNAGQGLNVFIAILGYGMMGAVACTLYYIPSSAAICYMAETEEGRAGLIAARGVVAQIANVALVAVYLPLVKLCGGGEQSPRGFFLAAVISGIPYVAIIIWNFFMMKKYELNEDGTWKEELEIHKDEQGKKVPLGTQFKYLFTNRPAVILVLGIAVMYIVQAFRNSSAVYVFNYYFELEQMGTIALTGMTVAAVLGAVAMNPLIKIFKDSNIAYIFSIIAVGATSIIFWVLCKTLPFEAAQSSLKWGALFWIYILGGFFQGAYYNFSYVLLPMAVDYGTWKNGINQSGFIYSLNGFTLTAGGAVGSAVLGFALSGLGYYEGCVLTETLKSGLIWVGMGIPALLCFGQAIIQFFFGLGHKKYAQIQKDLKDREAAAAAEA